jgi:hypothetical protein
MFTVAVASSTKVRHYLCCRIAAKLLLGADFYPYSEENPDVSMFLSALKTARLLVGTWEPGARLLASLEGLPKRHWEDPVLRKILDNDEIDEQTGKLFIYCSSELPCSRVVTFTAFCGRFVKNCFKAFYYVWSHKAVTTDQYAIFSVTDS